MKRLIRQFLPIGLILLLSVVSLGCFTLMTVADMPTRPDPPSQTPLKKDILFAIGQPDQAILSKIKNPHALVFLGTSNSYLLVEGGEDLMQISKALDGKHLVVDPEPRTLFLKDEKIWGGLSLIYQPDKAAGPTDAEISALTHQGFQKISGSHQLYGKVIQIKGMVYPPVKISDTQVNSFKVRREISFYAPPKSIAVPVLTRIALMPLAISADVATAPLQALGFVYVILVSSAYH